MTALESRTSDAEEEQSGGSASWLKRLGETQSVWIVTVLILIVAFFGGTGGTRFFSASNFFLISQNLAVWAVLAVGMTFVIVTAGIDLAIGSELVFASVISAQVMKMIGGDGFVTIFAGVVSALLGGLLWGWINGFLVAKSNLPPLIVTLGTLSTALGFAEVITGGVNIGVEADSLTHFGVDVKVFGVPSLVIVAAVVVALGWIALHHTKFGRYTYAIGSNAEAARRVGINVDRHLLWVYSLTGLLAGLGALMYLAEFGTTTIEGQTLTNLNVITAVVIGGTSIFGGIGTMFGTVIGLFIPSVLRDGFVIIGVQPFWQVVVVGMVLIAAVYIDQTRRAAAMRGGKKRRPPKGGVSERAKRKESA
jgi:ribose transport system permease protein